MYIMDYPLLFHNKEHTPMENHKCNQPTSATFVDDINETMKTSKNITLQQTMTENLKIITEYMEANKLSLNQPKTKIFAISKDKETKESLRIEAEEPVTNDENINVLGITVQSDLKWNTQILTGEKSIARQLTNRLNALKRLVNYSDKKFSIQLANAIFMSKLTYGIEAWGFAPQYLIQRLQVIQNKAARIVLGNESLKYNNTKLLREMKWLPVEKLIILQTSKLCHKIIQTKNPKYLHERLTTEPNKNTRTKIGNKLGTKPDNIGKTTQTANTYCSKIYKIYNDLPSVITSIKEKETFKKYLKRYLHNPVDLPPSSFQTAGLDPGL